MKIKESQLREYIQKKVIKSLKDNSEPIWDGDKNDLLYKKMKNWWNNLNVIQRLHISRERGMKLSAIRAKDLSSLSHDEIVNLLKFYKSEFKFEDLKKDNRRFQTRHFGGSSVYTCRMCGRKTRETGDDESGVELCKGCLNNSYMENHHNDSGHKGDFKTCPKCKSEGYKYVEPKSLKEVKKI